MIYRGHVSKGKVVLENPAGLAEGTEVIVRLAVARKPKANGRRRSPARTESADVAPDLLKLAGSINDLPADASRTIDQVLYGRPRP